MHVHRHGFRVVQVLDVGATVTRDYAELKEVALFLTTPNVLPPGQALGLYISVSGEWQVNCDGMGSTGLQIAPAQDWHALLHVLTHKWFCSGGDL